MGSGDDIRSAELGVIARGGFVGRFYWACHDGRTSGLPYKASIFREWVPASWMCIAGDQRIARAECKASLPRYWQTVKGGAGA